MKNVKILNFQNSRNDKIYANIKTIANMRKIITLYLLDPEDYQNICIFVSPVPARVRLGDI